MIQGSCLCNRVQYQVINIGDIVHCHCQTCRKAHGAAFSSVAAVADNDFTIISGITALNAFESSPGKKRFFCSHCGSQIYAKRAHTQHIILRLGTLDTDITYIEKSHIWLSQKASWYDLHSELKEFQEFEPDS